MKSCSDAILAVADMAAKEVEVVDLDSRVVGLEIVNETRDDEVCHHTFENVACDARRLWVSILDE